MYVPFSFAELYPFTLYLKFFCIKSEEGKQDKPCEYVLLYNILLTLLSKKPCWKFYWRKEYKTQPSAMTLPTKMKCWSQQMIFRTRLTAWHVLAAPGNCKCMNLPSLMYLFFISICPKRCCSYFSILLYYSSECTSLRNTFSCLVVIRKGGTFPT